MAQPNPVPVGALAPGAYSYLNKDIDVCHNSAASVNKPTFITQCYESAASPTFNYLSSCSNLSEIPQNPNASATVVTSFPVFYGTEPSGDKDWGCFKAGDTAPAGITKYSTCYLRFTVDIEANTTDQLFTPITFS